MEEIVHAIKTYGPVITIGLTVLATTPPVYKAWVRPILLALKRALLREVHDELEVFRSHTNSKVLHLNKTQRDILKEIEESRES